jgi:hypothetical protein
MLPGLNRRIGTYPGMSAVKVYRLLRSIKAFLHLRLVTKLFIIDGLSINRSLPFLGYVGILEQILF